MPILSTVTGSFFAGRRANSFGEPPWSPANDITAALWLDASDTSSYSLSGSIKFFRCNKLDMTNRRTFM